MRLPRRSSETWQGGVVRARAWVEDPDGRVRRPLAAVWVSLTTGLVNVQLTTAEDPQSHAGVALQVLVDLGLKFARGRPAHLEVADGALGAQLAAAHVWRATPDALRWLRAHAPHRTSKKRRKR